jgi:hypothetical protein
MGKRINKYLKIFIFVFNSERFWLKIWGIFGDETTSKQV